MLTAVPLHRLVRLIILTLNNMKNELNCKTPDGLNTYAMKGIGLVVSAEDHNRKIAHANAALDELWKTYGNGYGTPMEKVIANLQLAVDSDA